MAHKLEFGTADVLSPGATPHSPDAQGQRKLSFRFVATGMLFLLPLAVLLCDFQGEIGRGLKTAQLEREGVAFSRPVTDLLLDTVQADGNSARSTIIAADVAAVDRADRAYGVDLGTRDRWRKLRQEWQALNGPRRDSVPQAEAEEPFEQGLADLLTTVGNNSNLILDPDIDSYYTMDSVITQLPLIVLNTGQAKSVASHSATGPNGLSPVDMERLTTLQGQIQTPLIALRYDLGQATGVTPSLRFTVDTPAQVLDNAVQVYINGVNQPRLPPSSDDIFEAGRQYNRAALDGLDGLLAQRINEFAGRRARVDCLAGACTFFALLFFLGLYRATMCTIQQAREAEVQTRRSEERYRSLVEASPDSILVSAEDRIVYVNQATLPLLGAAQAEELLGRSVIDFVHPAYQAEAEEKLVCGQVKENTARGQVRALQSYKFLRLDGASLDGEAVSTPIFWEGHPAGQVLIRDVTERVRAEAAVHESEARLRTVIASVPVIVFALDTRGVFTFSDGKGLEALGIVPGESVGRSFFEVYAGQSETLDHIHLALAGAAHTWTSDFRGRYHETHVAPMRDRDGAITGIVGVAYDLTDHKQLERELAHQAFHDSLTGLPNRSLFLDRLQHALARSQRRQSAVAVLFVDLDNFKVVNDSLGHAAGDALLSEVAERLGECARAGDTVARLGGDEFTLLLEDLPGPAAATDIAARIAETLRRPLMLEGHAFSVTASIGLAVSDLATDGNAGDLLRQADVAMYQAKNSGKARAAVFDRGMNVQAQERMELEGDLRRAIAENARIGGELILHYQPIVSLDTGTIVEVEALARWMHPRRGLLPPLSFIPIAEECGMIVDLGLWVLREACRQTRKWQVDYPHTSQLVVSVNLSLRQLEEPHLVAQVACILAETGLSPECLTLEITESVMMNNSKVTINCLYALKALGVRLAVDDFGTGYSSMAYLSEFPLDTLKIDRAFVSRLDQADGRAIICAMVTLGHSLGLAITSEGIETEWQWQELQAMGSDRGQGYLFARPQTAEALETWLSDTGSDGTGAIGTPDEVLGVELGQVV